MLFRVQKPNGEIVDMKKMLLLSVVLTLSVLAGCGNTGNSTHQVNSEHGESHAGHGTGAEQDSSDQGQLTAAFTFPSGSATANKEIELHVQITDQKGVPVNDFELNHEKLLHLIIVNRDLSNFSHVHPDFQGEGRFSINTQFPAGGDYKLFADFKPAGGSSTTLSQWVKVEGEPAVHTDLKADTKLVKEVGDKEVELAVSNTNAKEETILTFHIRDARTKAGIDNLEPYLGAVGHVVILSEDANQYLHVHPLDEKAKGPEAQFATTFPQAGLYKIWGQFQHRGEVITVPYVVEVKEK